jgi:hypothetical protein
MEIMWHNISPNFFCKSGFSGFHDKDPRMQPILLTELVEDIHHDGGTVLGGSRGGFDLERLYLYPTEAHQATVRE